MNPDPSAAAARTRLAWRRTGLAAAVVPLLAVRPAFAPGAGAAAVLVAALAMLGWAALVVLSYHRARTLDRPGGQVLLACAVLTVALAVISGLVVTI